MAKSKAKSIPVADEAESGFIYVPLGGTGEIGMNFNLYGCDGAWLAVDCGMGFSGPEIPEAEILLPDPDFIARQREDLLGIVVTHAHEDHIGGIARLWPQLRCPIYATPFAAALIRRKLQETSFHREVRIHVIPPGGAFELGPFKLRYIRMTHSTPQAQALAITTSYGTVLHTGDWKFDPSPVVGELTDEAGLRALGDEGVLALISDSTCAMVEGHSGSEQDVKASFEELLPKLTGRVAVTCFASNVARVSSVISAATRAGRRIALVGRSLNTYVAAAQEVGYLQDIPDFVAEEDIADIPDDRLLLLVTGSQGEPRSAMSRIAADTHRYVVLGEGDKAIFSARAIPGNERAIFSVQDMLARRGVEVIVDSEVLVHVSGHPAREELKKLYQLVRPKFVIPTHGEWRHLSAQAALAGECGVKSLLVEDGDVVLFGASGPRIVDSVPTGRLVVDGDRILPLKGSVLAARKRMLFNGVVIGSFAVDARRRVRGLPKISAPGLLDEMQAQERLGYEQAFHDLLEGLDMALREDEAAFASAACAGLRRIVGKKLGKRPLVDVNIINI